MAGVGNYLLIINISFSSHAISVSDAGYAGYRIKSRGYVFRDIGVQWIDVGGEEFLRLISFIFVRLIIQFRLYVVDRFEIITMYTVYIYIFLYLFCTLHPPLIRDSIVPYVFTFHTALRRIILRRDTFLHPRVHFISRFIC